MTINDIDERAKVGTTTYKLKATKFVDGEPKALAKDAAETLGTAKAAAASWMPKRPDLIQITRGTWQGNDFEHDRYGVAYVVTWELDEDWTCNGFPDGSGGIDWEEDGDG